MMTKREAMIGTAVMAASALIGASAAVASFHARPPGWEYGRSNCGPRTSDNTNRRACEGCCRDGLQHAAPVDPFGFQNDCYSFCEKAMWKEPQIGFWHRIFL